MNYRLLLQCYLSGQMSERQWQEHLKDEVFKAKVERLYSTNQPNQYRQVRTAQRLTENY